MDERDFIKDLAEWIEDLIIEICGIECPHCNTFLEHPTSEDIEKWLKGD